MDHRRWKYEGNPSGFSNAFIYVAEDQNQIMGHFATMPADPEDSRQHYAWRPSKRESIDRVCEDAHRALRSANPIHVFETGS
jgi:hypothetical protein